jgi:hypothetical protein
LGDVAIQAAQVGTETLLPLNYLQPLVQVIYPRLVDQDRFKAVVVPNGFQYDDERADAIKALGL